MRKLIFVSLTILLLCCAAATELQAQQPTPTPGPLTFYYDYSVFPGKEEELNSLIRTVGAPVRDKLMAEGVVMAVGYHRCNTANCSSKANRTLYLSPQVPPNLPASTGLTEDILGSSGPDTYAVQVTVRASNDGNGANGFTWKHPADRKLESVEVLVMAYDPGTDTYSGQVLLTYYEGGILIEDPHSLSFP